MTKKRAEKPAILVAAFGTSTKAQVTYDAFDAQLKAALPGYEVRWAFTSEIIREKMNAKTAKDGSAKRLQSIQQALADLESEGYDRVAVQPLHIFPGEEYEEVLELVKGFPGVQIQVGESLFHRWESVNHLFKVLSKDFLPIGEGANVLVAHGSPTTGVASNITYLGMERLLSKEYPNTFLGCVDGVVPARDALAAAAAHKGDKVRFIPLMYVAGDHVMNDVMGDNPPGGEVSWKETLVKAGKTLDMPKLMVGGDVQYRGLGFIPEVNEVFIKGVQRVLERF